MTKKQIKERINRLEVEMHRLRSYENIPGYSELRDKIQRMKEDYDKLIWPKLDQMRDEINYLKAEYAKPSKEKPIIPEHIQKWFHNWQRGIDFGYNNPYIRWISPDEKYIIITTPGGTSGQGTAMGTGSYYYASTRHYLVKVLKDASWHDRIGSQVAEHEGRLDKETMQKWIKITQS